MKAKRLVSAVLATAMAFACAVSASANGNGHNYGEYVPEVGDEQFGCYYYIIGDVNRDYKITVTDITLVAAHVKGKRALKDPIALEAADTNKDGSINITDVIRIAAYVKGQKK